MPGARPRRRAAEDDRRLGTRGRRHPRRVPDFCARPRNDRPARPGGLPRRRWKLQAPEIKREHGPGPRRGPHHDGACRQGPGSAGRVPGRWRQRSRSASSICRGCCRSTPATATWRGKGYLWRSASDVANALLAAADGAAAASCAEEEYRRLLYVGMTRAEDRLIVCGYHGKRAPTRTPGIRSSARALAGDADSAESPASGRPAMAGAALPHDAPPPVGAGRTGRAAAATARPPRLAGRAAAAPAAARRSAAAAGAVRRSALIDDEAGRPCSSASPLFDARPSPAFAIARGLAAAPAAADAAGYRRGERASCGAALLRARRRRLAGGRARTALVARSLAMLADAELRAAFRAAARAPKCRSWAR